MTSELDPGLMHFASYYRWLIVRDWLRVPPNHRVLDVGCDDGQIIARLNAASRVALDLNPRCPDRGVHLAGADARALPLPAGVFDTVLAFDLIEHVDDDWAVLAELGRVLAPGGTLWISTPAAGFKIFPAFLTARANRGFGHVRNGYTETDLRARLPVGLEVDLMLWNEPLYRFMLAPLRVVDSFSSWLARRMAGWCNRIDRRFRSGMEGHLFVSARRASSSTLG